MKRIIIIICLIIITGQPLASQGADKIEVLNQKIEEAYSQKEYSKAFEYQLELANIYIFSGKSPAAIIEYQKIADNAFELGMKDDYHEALNALIQMYLFTREYHLCDSLLNIVLNEKENLDTNKASAINAKGQIQIERSQYKEAEKSLLEYVRIHENRNDSTHISVGYSSLGKLAQLQGDSRKAINLILKSIELRPDKSDFAVMGNYQRIATLYLGQKNYYKSLEYIDKAINICLESNLLKFAGVNYITKGEIQIQSEQIEDAKETFQKAIDIIRENNIWRVKSFAFLGLAKISRIEKDMESMRVNIDSARSYRHQIVNNGQLINYHGTLASYYLSINDNIQAKIHLDSVTFNVKNSENIRVHQRLYNQYYQYYKNTGQKHQALDYLELSTQIKDSLYNTDQMAIVYDLEAQYQKHENEQEIVNLNTTNTITNLKLKQQRSISFVSLIGLLLVSILSYFLFKFYKQSKFQNQIIKKSNDEKDVLLREIHHRVKNNLQFISSLLKLQSRHVSDPKALYALKEGQDRVKSMALIHQNLYQEENLTGVDIKNYFEKLTSNLFHSYNISPEKIKLQLDIESVNLDVDSVIPIGLIVNELISNPLKYAFPDKREGLIIVRLKEENNKLFLEVEDNGVGMDENQSKKLDDSFGYRLINAFKNQLDAEIEINSENGTSVILSIKEYKKVA